MVCAREYSFNDAENRKTFKRALARHCSIFFPWAELHSRVLFLCPLTEETRGKQFSKLFKEFLPKT